MLIIGRTSEYCCVWRKLSTNIVASAIMFVGANFALPPAMAQTPVSYVQPINWSKYNGIFGVQSGDTFGQGLVLVLQNEDRFELASIPGQYPVANDGFGYPGMDYYY